MAAHVGLVGSRGSAGRPIAIDDFIAFAAPGPPELALLAFIALGAYVQAIAGFAMAMLAVALAAACTSLPLPLVSTVAMVAAFVNVIGGLHGAYAQVDRRGWATMVALQVPGVFLGLALLSVLSASADTALRVLLGLFVLGAGLAMMLRPEPRPARSPGWAFAAAGASGGVLNGLFAAGGPVAGWFLYRQPMPVAHVRATLLAFFMVGSGTRIVGVAVSGGFTPPVLRLALLAIPVTLLFTWLGRAYAPPFGEQATRRAAFALLLVCGAIILVGAFVGR